MKKLLLFFAVIGIALTPSCREKPVEEPEKPFPIGSWRSAHNSFSLTVQDAVPSSLKEMRELETSGAVPEAKSYRLNFNEDGTGFGSGVLPDGTGRYDFEFNWQLSDNKFTITQTESEYEGIFYFRLIRFKDVVWNEDNTTVDEIIWEDYSYAWEEVIWRIEESSAKEMVLSTSTRIQHGGPTGIGIQLDETHNYRYTFEKVK